MGEIEELEKKSPDELLNHIKRNSALCLKSLAKRLESCKTAEEIELYNNKIMHQVSNINTALRLHHEYKKQPTG